MHSGGVPAGSFDSCGLVAPLGEPRHIGGAVAVQHVPVLCRFDRPHRLMPVHGASGRHVASGVAPEERRADSAYVAIYASDT